MRYSAAFAVGAFLLLLLWPGHLPAQITGTARVDSVGLRPAVLLRDTVTLSAAPDSQRVAWGCDLGCTAGGAMTPAKTARSVWWWVSPLTRTDSVRIWSCWTAWKSGKPYAFCGNWHHYGGMVATPLAFSGNWIWPRDTVRVAAVYGPSCSGARAALDSLTGVLVTGCKLASDTTKWLTIQMCQVSIAVDSSVVVWAGQSKTRCAADTTKVRAKFGSRFRPDLPPDTSLVFGPLAEAGWQ